MQTDLHMDEPIDAAPPELTPQARDALQAEAGGDVQRLRILTATAKFLAETEHAPSIDTDIILRAAALNPPSAFQAGGAHAAPAAEEWPAPLAGGWPAPLKLAGAVSAVLVLGAAVLLIVPHARHHAAMRQPAMINAASTPAPAASRLPPPPQTMTAQASPQAAVPASNAAPPPAAPAQPVPAIPVVQIRFYLASPGSPARARFVEQRLGEAGFIVRTIPDLSPAPPRHAAAIYFHPGDAAAAATAKRQSMLLNGRPILARRIRSHRAPPPGTIELLVP